MATPEVEWLPSSHVLRREVSMVLRSSEDPNILTFKQVRLAVEKSLGMPEGAFHNSVKSRIKEAVHSVMDEIEAETKEVPLLPHEVEPKDGVREHKSERARVDLKCSKRRKSESGNASGRRNHVDGKARGSRKADEEGAKVTKGKKTRGDCRERHGHRNGSHQDDSLVCVLSETARSRKQVNVKMWRGNIHVDVREYYAKDADNYAPGKKGITLSPSQWDTIRNAVDAIDAMVDDLK